MKLASNLFLPPSPLKMKFSSCFLTLQLASLWATAQAQVSDLEVPQTFETLPYNFTFAAVNKTLPNANSTGSPLVLGAGGATGGLTIYTTSTWYSFPYNDHPSLGLVNRALRAFDKLGNWGTNVTIVRSGEKLVWSRSIMYPNPEDNSRVYSAARVPSSEYPVLAAYNITTLWLLCPDMRFRGQTQLVFNVSAVIPAPQYLSFDPYLCYDVTVNLVPV